MSPPRAFTYARVLGRLGGFRPAGEIADVAIPALRGGGRAPRVVSVVHAATAAPGRDPHQVVLNATHEHLSAPHYTAMLRLAGLKVHHTQPSVGSRVLLRSGTFLYGSPAEIAEGIRAYHRAGVDEVVVNTAGVALTDGLPAAEADLFAILENC